MPKELRLMLLRQSGQMLHMAVLTFWMAVRGKIDLSTKPPDGGMRLVKAA